MSNWINNTLPNELNEMLQRIETLESSLYQAREEIRQLKKKLQ